MSQERFYPEFWPNMKQFEKVGSFVLWLLQGLLVTLLLFQEQFELPIFGIGHLHPLLLHLPIGFGVVLVLFSLIKNQVNQGDDIFRPLLISTALFSSATAILGLFLAKEGSYDSSQVLFHQWSGIAVSFLYFAWTLWQQNVLIFALIGLLTLIFAGHTGASITHGEDYLTFGKEAQEITPTSLVFESMVQPILNAKCESCHNDQKSKGGLKMNSLANLLKGGKNGPIWKPGDLNSHLLQRIHLPLSDKKHMPPAGKAQLTENEQMILQIWIKEGANVVKKVGEMSAAFQQLVSLKSPTKQEKSYDFQAASSASLEAVNTPFCTVYPIAYESPALQADFFVAAKFDLKALENLQKIDKQLIGLNLNKMPVSDTEIGIIAQFKALEKLILNGTQLSDKGLLTLTDLPNLEEISLASTSISSIGIEGFLKTSKKIKKIYLWNTKIEAQQMNALKNLFPKVQFEFGFAPNSEILQINPPILVNERLFLKPKESLRFKHTIKDVLFRYTLNDSLPDSLSGPATKSIVPIQQFTKVRIRATKPGWNASNPIDLKVYKSNFIPQKIELLSPPAANYPAHGGMSLMDFEQGLREIKGVPNLTWLGFKEGDLDALASFALATKINGITLSYLEKTDSEVFPPSLIEIYAGNDRNHLQLISKTIPTMPKERNGYTAKAINLPLQTKAFSFYRIKAYRLKKMPSFVDNKGKGAWLKVDEILFY